MWITFLIFAAFFVAILAMAYFGMLERPVERDEERGTDEDPVMDASAGVRRVGVGHEVVMLDDSGSIGEGRRAGTRHDTLEVAAGSEPRSA